MTTRAPAVLKTETDKGTASQVPPLIESATKRMVPMKRTWQRNGLPSTPPPNHNLLNKEAKQKHHVPVKINRDMKETLPKALRTQVLTALTSSFGLVGLVQYAW